MRCVPVGGQASAGGGQGERGQPGADPGWGRGCGLPGHSDRQGLGGHSRDHLLLSQCGLCQGGPALQLRARPYERACQTPGRTHVCQTPGRTRVKHDNVGMFYLCFNRGVCPVWLYSPLWWFWQFSRSLARFRVVWLPVAAAAGHGYVRCSCWVDDYDDDHDYDDYKG